MKLLASKCLGGTAAQVRNIRGDYVVSMQGGANPYPHPWKLSPYYRPDEGDPTKGEWRARVRPGFVNSQDVVIPTTTQRMTKDGKGNPAKSPTQGKVDVPLTDAVIGMKDEDFPNGKDAWLTFNDWFNPLAASATVGEGKTGLSEVQVTSGAYPAFFKRLGVKYPESTDGKDPTNPTTTFSYVDQYNREKAGTRRLMSADVVLVVDHDGSATDVTTSDPLTGQQVTVTQITLQKQNRYPYRLVTKARHTPIEKGSLLDRLKGSFEQANFTEVLMSRLWMVSPSDEPDDTYPDQRWTAYPQHFQFWNLNGMSPRPNPATNGYEPITFTTPIGLGLGNAIIASSLSPINDAMSSALNALSASDPEMYFWSI